MKYVIYLRVSTSEQCESFETQEVFCLRELPAGSEYIIIKDEKSGGRPFRLRKELNEAIDMIQKGDVLVVYKYDRISRDMHQIGYIHTLVSNKRGSLLSVTQKGMDRTMIGVTAVMSDFERQNIRARTKDAMQYRKSKGQRVGYVPFGYKSVADERLRTRKDKPVCWIVTEESEQIILNRMIELKQQGLSLQKIAVHLQEEGYRNRKGNLFQPMSIWKILHNSKTHIEAQQQTMSLQHV